MKARSIALLMLALGCGLVASIGITQVIGNRDKGPDQTAGDTSSIFVAKEDILFGEPLTPDLLRLESWPKGKVKGALSRIEDIEGRRTRSKFYAGEPILENKLFAKGASEQGYSIKIPKGSRVVAVKVDRVSGSGLILPGDRVDVLVHLIRNPTKGVLETSTRTILQDVRVFAVNDIVETQEKGEEAMSAQTISLLVTPEHAQVVMLAEELGNIRLIMRSPEDDEIPSLEGISPAELLGTAEAEDRQSEEVLPGPDPGQSPGFLDFLKQMRAKKSPRDVPNPSQQAPPANRHRMQIVSGPEVRDIVLEMDPDRSDSAAGLEVWKASDWHAVTESDRNFRTPEPDQSAAEPRQSPPEADGQQKSQQERD